MSRKSLVPMQYEQRGVSRSQRGRISHDAGYPINYSGTQVNVFGQQDPENVREIIQQAQHPASSAHAQMGTYPYSPGYPPLGYTNNVQLGLVTEHMLRKLDESRLLTMTELMKRCYGNQAQPSAPYVQEPLTPRNQGIEYGPPRAHSLSPGNGDWKGQIQHIYAHLVEIAQEDKAFRRNIGEPILGEINSADLEESSNSYILTLAFEKPREISRESVKSRRSLSAAPKVKSQRLPEEQEYEKENLQQEGTMKPYRVFNPEADAEALRKAMKGLGTDEDAIINVLGHRCNKQRQEIIKMYKTMFGKDLVKDLKSELSGDFWKLVRALCIPPADYDATELRNAIKGLGTDDATVIEIICTRTNKSLKQICDSYKRLLNRSLEEDISGDTSGHYKRLLISLLQANRSESNTVDKTLAKKDAQLLYEAGAKKWGTDESRFNSIIVSRSYPQLRATFIQYEKLVGKSVEDAIKGEMSGDLEAGMLAIVRCVNNKAGYFAKVLYKAMKGLGTDDDALIRIVVSRSEVDMVQIKDEFFRDYKQSLAQFIADDTSGDYRKLLLTVIGESSAGKKGTSSRVVEPDDESD